jgi:hypothetical protein
VKTIAKEQTMTKATTDNITPIDDALLAEYPLADYRERVYPSVYFTLRELYGLALQRQSDDFDWALYKSWFTEAFGDPKERKFTLEQLLDFARRKFDKSLEQLIALNRTSYERRLRWQQQQQQQALTDDLPY